MLVQNFKITQQQLCVNVMLGAPTVLRAVIDRMLSKRGGGQHVPALQGKSMECPPRWGGPMAFIGLDTPALHREGSLALGHLVKILVFITVCFGTWDNEHR